MFSTKYSFISKTKKPAEPKKTASKKPPMITYETKKTLGIGSFGKVEKVILHYPENSGDLLSQTTKDYIDNNEWVLKTISRDEFSREPIILARYQPTFKPFSINKNITGWFTKLLPGEMLDDLKLDFYQTLDLINKIVLVLNLHHHNTPSTGSAVIHGDIKELNILGNLKEVNFTDYGLSLEVDDDPDITVQRSIPFLAGYFAPEAIEGRWGIKTDIYMIAYVISDLIKKINRQVPDTDPNVKYFIKHFITRMKAEEYNERPDSDEVLKFFHTLNLFYKVNKSASPANETEHNNLKYEYAAKLALLAHNQWNNKLDSSDTKTWQNYDFAKRPDVNRLIVKLANEDSQQASLSKINFANITDETPSKVLEILNRYELLNKEVTIALMNNQQLRKEIIAVGSYPLELIPKILSTFSNEIPKPQLKQMLDYVAAMNIDLDLTFLASLRGPLKDRRETAIFIINRLVDGAKTSEDVNLIKQKLVGLGRANQIDYLYKRQGFFKFSIHNHKHNNEKVSGTLVELMKSIDKKMAQLDQNTSLAPTGRY